MAKRKRKDSNDNEELPLYNSFEENDGADSECVLCGQKVDDPVEFGKKVSMHNITVHHFCLVGNIRLI